MLIDDDTQHSADCTNTILYTLCIRFVPRARYGFILFIINHHEQQPSGSVSFHSLLRIRSHRGRLRDQQD
jgi:hypothetical protein